MATLNYAQAGVDRDAADKLVGKIGALAKTTLNRRVRSTIGGYASLFEIDKKRWLAASTDGVGTKLKLAFRLKQHRTVGIDLVAMSVNDLLCVGAEPWFFLDYFATGKLDTGVAEDVIAGIVEGCRQSACALVGGETAEMPDIYGAGEYDLAGFAVGMVDPKRALPGTGANGVKPGDVILGLPSSGCHSNGYSLLRRLLPDGSAGDERAAELLTPTRIYVRALKPLVDARWVKGLAHITGSGFLNVPRISEKVSYEIALPDAAKRPRIYEWVKERSGLGLDELGQTFNLGIGMVIVASPANARKIQAKLARMKEPCFELGQVVKRRSGKPSEIFLSEGAQSVVIS